MLGFIFRENTKSASSPEQSQRPNKALFRQSTQKPSADTHKHKCTHSLVLVFMSVYKVMEQIQNYKYNQIETAIILYITELRGLLWTGTGCLR